MKPIRNRVHCPECNKSKMLFESESQALNFIKFNSDEILEENGYAPIRAYYCVACGGWHVTSQKLSEKNLSSRTEVMIRQNRAAELSSQIHKLGSLIEKAKLAMREMRLGDAKTYCMQALDLYQKCLSEKGMTFQKRVLYKDICECVEEWSVLKDQIKEEEKFALKAERKSAMKEKNADVSAKLDKLEKRIEDAKLHLRTNQIALAKHSVSASLEMYKAYSQLTGEDDRKALLRTELDVVKEELDRKYPLFQVRKNLDLFEHNMDCHEVSCAAKHFNEAIEYLTSALKYEGNEEEKKSLFKELDYAQNRLKELFVNKECA